MPRATAREALFVLRERKMNGERASAPTVDDHGAVVPGRLGVEQADEQRDAQLGVERDATMHLGVDALLARQHDERARGGRGEMRGGLDEHVVPDRARVRLRTTLEQERRRAVEPSPQVVLAQDDDEEPRHAEREQDRPRGQHEPRALGPDVREREAADRGDGERALRAPQQGEAGPQTHRHKRDVRDGTRIDGLGPHHGPLLSAPRPSLARARAPGRAPCSASR